MKGKYYAEIEGKMWQVDYPFCGGCPELVVGYGCGYEGNGCKYPDKRIKRPINWKSVCMKLNGDKTASEINELGNCISVSEVNNE